MVTVAWMIALRLMFNRNPLAVQIASGFTVSKNDLALKTLFISSVLTTFFVIGPELRYFIGVIFIVVLVASTPLVLLFTQQYNGLSKN